jgi:hypothetical protein
MVGMNGGAMNTPGTDCLLLLLPGPLAAAAAAAA